MTSESRMTVSRKLDWCVSGALGLVAAAVYALTTSGAAFPGESAHLMAVWAGLDTAAFNAYPVFSFFARLFGGGNLLAPFSGVVAVVALYHVAAFFIRERILADTAGDDEAAVIGAVGGGTAAGLFLFTPAAWSAYTHVEPRGFAVTWLLLGATFFLPLVRGGAVSAWLASAAIGAFAGLGFLDTPTALYLFPLEIGFVWLALRRRGDSPYGPTALCVFSFLLAFFAPLSALTGDTAAFALAHKELAQLTFAPKGWFLVLLFSTLPFLVSLLSSGRGFNGKGGVMSWIFHLALTFVAILAYATPFSPSSLMRPYGILPVTAALFTAWLGGSLAAYWWIQARTAVANAGESVAEKSLAKAGRALSIVVGAVAAAVVALTVAIEAATFDGDRGAFADEIARRIIADMGARSWIVTDGTLDDHLRLAAREAGKDLGLVCLQRDTDEDYIRELTAGIKASGLGGEHNRELVLSLSLGVLPFLQDWLAADPQAAATNVVIFGAPDLWYGAGLKAVPETFFFGGDPARLPAENRWAEVEPLVSAPKGWGSYQLRNVEDPIDRRRLNLRRHFGFVANNRAFCLQDLGRDDEAFDLYDLVLREIDPDNVCALFNEYEMANTGYRRAAARSRELTARIGAIVEDKGRRYSILPLGNYYGYVRNPGIFIRMGLAWASRGRPGEALSQIQRAIDFIPSDSRDTVMNMMAALYANDERPRESREIYEEVLGRDAFNHDALIGLMRLELAGGNVEKATEYLERAVAAAGDDPRVRIEVAMLHLLKGDLAEAKKELRRITDADRGNMRAWSLLSAVVMQQIDATADEREKQALTKELKGDILASMEKLADGTGDYNLQTTRAFILLREGGEENLREARDAFASANLERPDVATTGDLVLGLDIRLDDKEHAESAAREVLRRNRKAPLANYVMGSLALGRGDYEAAEAFLRRSADADKPVVLAMNDLAEVLRRNRHFSEAERYARKAVDTDPSLYVAWETLGAILMDSKGDLDEAEECVRKACDLSRDKDGKEADVRMLVSLARVQSARGEQQRAKGTLRKVQGRLDELTEFERREFEELKKSVR